MPLTTEQHVVLTRQTVRQLCQQIKLSLVEQTKMITAASELSRNTLIHGGGGRMRWELLARDGRAGLALHFEDEGPVIEELEDAPPSKRRRLEIEDSESTPESPTEPQEPSKPQGLLSADTLESLKYFTEIRQRNAQASGAVKVASKPPQAGLGLGGYGSDEDDG